MSSSLRSRLWWSYVFVSLSALAVVAIVLFIYIIRNPSTYRQASARLIVVAALVRKNENSLSNLTAPEIQARIEQVSKSSDVRIVVFNQKRQVVADSQVSDSGTLRMPWLPRLRVSSVIRDQQGQYWIYIVQHLKDGNWLLVATPRPKVPLLSVLSDELVIPIFGAAVVALVISLIVAFWLARWIGKPLQRVVAASHQMPSLVSQSIHPSGPHEVQELTRAFNEMNTRVQNSHKSQRDFVANVSHELKTPITSIQGFAQAILDGTADNPESREQAARVIFNEASAMHRMVLDLLDLARLDSGTLEMQELPINLKVLLQNTAEKFTPQAQASEVSIKVDCDDLPEITGDGDRLAQVFSNLVDNALKHSSAGGTITLAATYQTNNQESQPPGIKVEIIDTGSGIPSDALPHIFERFYQADPSRPGGEKHGTGLGLAIVKEIVEKHGGKISVRSKLGSGSTFTINLPTPSNSTANFHRNKK